MQEAPNQIPKAITSGPSPHDQKGPSPHDQKGPSAHDQKPIQEETHHVGKPTEPHRISSNLHRAVQSARNHGSSSVFSPPATFEVKEEATFCDNRPSQDITFAAQTPSGMAIYAQRALSEAARKEFLKSNAAAINTFCLLLNSVAEVFALPPSALHIYYDPGASTIAFNLAGSIFCNVSFFLQLHAEDAANKRWSADAFKYWWVTMCHELAHNLVSEHGSNHSFYT